VIEDHQFIHVDPERAKKETAFGTTVAHGFLTMSLLSIMSYEVMAGDRRHEKITNGVYLLIPANVEVVARGSPPALRASGLLKLSS